MGLLNKSPRQATQDVANDGTHCCICFNPIRATRKASFGVDDLCGRPACHRKYMATPRLSGGR